MEYEERWMSVAVCDSSGLERNVCQKMKKEVMESKSTMKRNRD